MSRIDLLISVLPKEADPLKQTDELLQLKREISRLLNEKGYRFIIADNEGIHFQKKGGDQDD